MNGAAVKAQRRQVRKAFGLPALGTIQHIDQGLVKVSQALELQRQAIVALTEIRNRGLWGRLRWLLVGR